MVCRLCETGMSFPPPTRLGETSQFIAPYFRMGHRNGKWQWGKAMENADYGFQEEKFKCLPNLLAFELFFLFSLCFSNKNAEIRNEILWKNSTMVSEFFR